MNIFEMARVALRSSPRLERWRLSHPMPFDFFFTLFSSVGRRLTFGFLVAAVGWFAFFGVVQDFIAGDPLVQADLRVISFLQTLRTPGFNEVMLFFTYLGNWQVITAGAVIFAFLTYLSRQWWWLCAFATSILGEQLLSQVMKFMFHRDRPNLENALLPAAGGSFPSGHTLVAFAFYGFIACYAVRHVRNWLVKTLIVAGAVLVILGIGFSRIYLGVHWPSDVIASLALGPAWVATVLTVFKLTWPATAPDGLRPTSRWVVAAGLMVWMVAVVAFFLTHPLVARVAASQQPIALKGRNFDTQLFGYLPRFTEDITGAQIEPINAVVIGSEADLDRAFVEAGWVAAVPLSIKSGLKLIFAELWNNPDPNAPGLPAFLKGLPNDKTFERATAQNSARERHHLHLWTTNLIDDGLAVWAGTAHLDTSANLYRGVTYHKIDPDVDRERDALIQDLTRSNCVSAEQVIDVTSPMRGQNIIHNSFFTDGKAIQILLHCN